jgi:hypothetical protein
MPALSPTAEAARTGHPLHVPGRRGSAPGAARSAASCSRGRGNGTVPAAVAGQAVAGARPDATTPTPTRVENLAALSYPPLPIYSSGKLLAAWHQKLQPGYSLALPSPRRRTQHSHGHMPSHLSLIRLCP